MRSSQQIMSADKYLRIFLHPNWGYCVYYLSVLKIVLAGEYSPTWRVYTNRARAQYLMDYKFLHIGGTFFHFHWCWSEQLQLLIWKFSFKEVEESQISTVKRFFLFLQSIILKHFIDCSHSLSVHTCQVQKLIITLVCKV